MGLDSPQRTPALPGVACPPSHSAWSGNHVARPRCFLKAAVTVLYTLEEQVCFEQFLTVDLGKNMSPWSAQLSDCHSRRLCSSSRGRFLLTVLEPVLSVLHHHNFAPGLLYRHFEDRSFSVPASLVPRLWRGTQRGWSDDGVRKQGDSDCDPRIPELTLYRTIPTYWCLFILGDWGSVFL